MHSPVKTVSRSPYSVNYLTPAFLIHSASRLFANAILLAITASVMLPLSVAKAVEGAPVSTNKSIATQNNAHIDAIIAKACGNNGNPKNCIFELFKYSRRGNIKAEIELANILCHLGKRFDNHSYYKTSALLYSQALAAGSTSDSVLVNLGLLYMKGEGVPRNYAKAYTLWSLARSKNNSLTATINLSNMYLNGTGVPQNYHKSFILRRIAANRGNIPSEFILGSMYLTGMGTKKDINKAIKWLSLAANENNGPAQDLLGSIYLYKKYGHVDYQTAFKWFKKSANNNNNKAAIQLAYLYLQGKGIPQNYTEGCKWLIIAQSELTSNTEMFSIVHKVLNNTYKQLTHDQISKAQEQASTWYAEHNKHQQ